MVRSKSSAARAVLHLTRVRLLHSLPKLSRAALLEQVLTGKIDSGKLHFERLSGTVAETPLSATQMAGSNSLENGSRLNRRLRFNGAVQSQFYAVVLNRNRAAAEKTHGVALQSLAGKQVQVSGKIALYRKQPQIVVSARIIHRSRADRGSDVVRCQFLVHFFQALIVARSSSFLVGAFRLAYP
jgi:hypothetical protein